ncbi:MAG: hypothetical protein E8D47_12360 [Nitrospira sp.]|nr:MAG: hypothetical protein E8D47_12360 [Nitrospira sp.]
MLTRLLLVLILVAVLPGTGWAVEEEVGVYFNPVEPISEMPQGMARWKREFLQLEDLKIGDGPLAALGRKISADIEVRYADGTLIYRGPAISYAGLKDATFIHSDVHERGMMSLQQEGIFLGLNGMAVGGKRRMVIAPNLVCYSEAVGESTAKGANPRHTCTLVATEGRLEEGQSNTVRKETLIVEATLTASCIPGRAGIPRVFTWESCRDSDRPRREPSDPIWRAY